MQIIEQLCAVSVALGCHFTVKGAPIPAEKVFSPTGLLPAFMRRADQLASFCLGDGLGVTFERAEGTMLNVKVVFDDKVSNVLRLLCATDVLVEIMQNAPSHAETPLDELMIDY